MPVNTLKAQENFERYRLARDNGHLLMVEKMEKCEQYFYGNHWRAAVRAELEAVGKPVITINKVWSSMLTIMGEQIGAQGDVAFQPSASGNSETADALNKVYLAVTKSQDYQFLESRVFDSGAIRSRGFYDLRIEFTDQMQGEATLEYLNAKNVLIDPDASDYDPDKWKEVFVTKWLSADDIGMMYTEADGELLRQRGGDSFAFGVDSMSHFRNTFGGGGRGSITPFQGSVSVEDLNDIRRIIRVIERQYKEIRRREFFVDLQTGDMRRVPLTEAWDRDRINFVLEKFKLGIVEKKVEDIRWTVTADDVVLHDEFSPYKHFTVIPYFPVFFDGATKGLVEEVLSPQDLLNKSLSQELHVVNTTANSGWQMEEGQLTNMTTEELETRGAQTGLVLERQRGTAPLDKITPNTVPQGLDRLSFKGDEYTKELSGASDSKRGFDRADVAAKAIRQKMLAGSVNYAKALFNLAYTRKLVARNTLDLIQEFYTEERIFRVTTQRVGADAEDVSVNVEMPDGRIVNDLTVGEYDVVVTDVQLRDTFDESVFQEAVKLKEIGINLPDATLVEVSRLPRKNELAKELRDQQGAATDPNAQRLGELEVELKMAEIELKKADAVKRKADSALALAKARSEAQGSQSGVIEAEKMALEAEKVRGGLSNDRQRIAGELQIKRNEANEKNRVNRFEANERVQAARAAARGKSNGKERTSGGASNE